MKKVYFFLLLCCVHAVVQAQTNYYSKASGDLNLTSTWGTNTDGTGTSPVNFTTANQVFNVRNNPTPTIAAAWTVSGTNAKIVVGDGTNACSFTVPAAYLVTATTNVSAAATVNVLNATAPTFSTLDVASTINYQGSGAQTVRAATYGSLIISGARAGTPAITLASGTIKVMTAFTASYTGSVTFSESGNTFSYGITTGGMTIAPIPYYNLTVANTSGTNTAGGNIDVTNALVTTSGGSLDMGTYNLTGTLATVTNNGTIKTSSTSATAFPAGKSWSGTTGTVQFVLVSGGQYVPTGTYKNLAMLNTSGTNTALGDLTVNTLLTTTAGGTLDMGTYALAGTLTTLTNNGTVQTQNSSPSPITTAKTWAGTGTVEFNGSSNQTIPLGTYVNLKISGSRTGTPTITLPAGTISVKTSLAASYTGSVLFANAGNTVTYTTTTGGCTIGNIEYNNLKLAATSGTNTAGGDITVDSTLTITSGGTLAMATYTLASAGILANNGTVTTQSTANPCLPAGLNWSGTTGLVKFIAATGGQYVPAGTYKTLTLANTGGTNTATGDIAVTGVITTTAGGTLDMDTYALGTTGSPVNGGTIATRNISATPLTTGKTWAGTINYNNTAGGQTVMTGTYTNLTLGNGSNAQTAAGLITVNGTLTTTAGGTLDMGTANRLAMGASAIIANNGTIKTSVPTATSTIPIPSGKNWGTTGTIEYAATAGVQTIVAGTYNNLQLDNTSGTNTAGILTVNGTLTTTAGGILNMSTNQLLGTMTTASNDGTIQTQNTTATPLPANVSWNGTGTVQYARTAGGQYIVAGTYNNLLLSNTSATMAVNGPITVNGTLTTTSGGIMDMTTYPLTGAGTIVNNGTVKTSCTSSPCLPPGINWTGTTGTVSYASLTGGQTVAPGTYKNLSQLNTSGTNTAAGDLTINTLLTTTAGGTLDMGAYAMNGTMTTLTNNGTVQTQNTSSTPFPAGKTWAGTGTVDYNGTGNQTIINGTYINLKISGTRASTPTITLPSGLITVTGSLAATYSGSISVANTGDTVKFSTTTGGKTIGSIRYNVLWLANTSGTNTASGDITIDGALITTSGGTFDMSSYDLKGTFAPINNGTTKTASLSATPIPGGLNWSGTTGGVTYSSLAGGQTIVGGTYKTLTLQNTSGTTNAATDLSIATSLVTTTGGTLNMGTYALSGAFAPTNNGTVQTQNTSSTPIPTGKAWAGTVEYNGTGAQTIVAVASYTNLTLSGARTATPAITLGVGNNTISVSGNFNVTYTGTVTFNNSTNTFNYSKTTGGQTIGVISYHALKVSNTSGTNTAAGNLAVSTTLTTTAGGTLDMGTYQLTGAFTPANAGILSTSNTSSTPIPAGKAWGGTVRYGSATGGQTIVSETSYTNLALGNTSGSNTTAANLVVNGTLTTSGGIMDMGTYTLSGTLTAISGSGTIQTKNTSAAPLKTAQTWPQTIEYNNAAGGQTIVAGTYNGGLTNSNTGGSNTIAAGAAVSVASNLTLSPASAIASNGVSITLSGNIAGTGNYTGTGTINMTGSGATISGANLTNIAFNNSGGFSLAGNPTVNGTLTLTAGKVDLGGNTITLATSATIAGSPSSSAMLVASNGGTVKKMLAGTGSFTYPVGDASHYSPATINITAGTFGSAYTTVTLKNVKHPLNTSTTNYINKYWTVSMSGISGLSYTASTTYDASDVAGTESSIISAEYPTPGSLHVYNLANTATHTLTTNATNSVNTDFTGVNSVPTVTVNPTAATICNGGSQTLTAAGSGFPPLTYTWAPATGLSATNGTTVSASPASTTTYTVTVTDGNGFTANATSAITIVAQPAVSVNASQTGSICPGVVETLTATSTGGGTGTATYTWSGPGISSPQSSGSIASYSVVPSPSYTMIPANAAGAYTVSLAYSGNGCITATAATAIVSPSVHQWQGGASGTPTSWNNDNNWICGITPVATDYILVPPTANQPTILAGNTGNVGNLFINSGAILTVSNTTALNIKGNLTNNGSITGTGTSNVILNGTGAQSLAGNGNIYNLELNNASGATISSNADTVTIKGALTLTAGTLNTNNTLMLYSDANGTGRIAAITGGGITGNVISQQYIPGGRRAMRFMGHPYSTYITLSQLETYMDITGEGGADNGFTESYTNNPSAYWYDTRYANSNLASDPGYMAYTGTAVSVDSNRFKRYQGIRILVRGAKGEGISSTIYTPSAVTVRTWGPVNTGNQSIPLVKGSAASGQDFNQISNPYPSPVDIGTAVKTAFDAGKIAGVNMFIWNPYLSTQGAYQNVAISATPYYLPANASFFIRAKNDGVTLDFTEANKAATATSAVLKPAVQNTSLYVYDGGYHLWDMLYFDFNDNATNNEDEAYDAVKPMNPAGMNFYSLSGDNLPMMVDSRPFESRKTIPLGISSDCTQEFIIRAENVVVPGVGKLYLHDKYMKKYVELLKGTEYAFSITEDAASQGQSRFELKMNPASITEEDMPLTLAPNPARDNVTIGYTTDGTQNATLAIMDIKGTTVTTRDLGISKTGSVTVAVNDLAAGIYIVTITSGKEKYISKLIKE